MIFLQGEEAEFILKSFHDFYEYDGSHTQVWCKRQYAPLYIHDKELQSLKKKIVDAFPEYTIAFDVIFESKGNRINWHTDHESLGPFLNDTPLKAIKENHFLSIHFNLTPNAGCLVVYNSHFLSYMSDFINKQFNIFSVLHLLFTLLILPFTWLFSSSFSNTQLLGNVFNNIVLHSVTSGDPRISYVVRMIKTDCVKTSRSCIEKSLSISKNCKYFAKFLNRLENEDVTLASHLLFTPEL
jgi:hypothetical protein